MIKTLQKKFVRTAMTAVTVLLVLLLGAINLINLYLVQRDLQDTLQMVADRVDKPDNNLVNTPYFLVQTDADGNVTTMDVSHVTEVTEEQAGSYAQEIFETYSEQLSGTGVQTASQDVPAGAGDQPAPQPGEADSMEGQPSGQPAPQQDRGTDPQRRVTGRISGYLYLAHLEGDGITILFLDPASEEFSLLRVLALSVILGAVCFLGMLAFVMLLSRRAIEPIAESMEKQRRFITDAGHELKTPLAIIQANTEAMELYQGESKWSRNIREQVQRLDGLTKNLLLLSRMDESVIAEKGGQEPVDLSALLAKKTDEFQEAFALRGIRIETEIAGNAQLTGNREQLDRLLSVLLENALKYTNENGDLRVSLQKETTGRNRQLRLRLENTCETLPQVPPEQLFDRFRRGDEARTRKKGGYGIGLAVAKACAEANGGRIRASYRESDRICFEIVFS